MQEGRKRQSKRAVWAKRLVYISLAVLVLLGIPFFLAWLADATGMTAFNEIFGPYILWNEWSGGVFVLAFFSIVALTGAIMFLMMMAFDTTEGAW
ncbi:hypothetical protein EU538_06990 [Candidatus Thorarchaeota archaeon]|nr:MAG: hypothetical protein EU538_06990 [Candidatus Thorarchaeota archaeon]